MTNENWPTQFQEPIGSLHQLQIVLVRFPKSDTRVKADALRSIPAATAQHLAVAGTKDIFDDVCVSWIVLHRFAVYLACGIAQTAACD